MFKRIYTCFAVVLLLASCVKDVKIKDLEPVIALPLVNSRLDVYDVLARQDSNELVVVDPSSGKLALFYESDPIGFEIADFVSIPNLNETFTLQVGSTLNLPAGTTHTFGDDYSANFSLTGGEELYGIDFSGGDLSLNLSSPINSPVDYTISFTSITKNASPISFSGTINPGQTSTNNTSLANAIGDFVDNASNPNTFEFTVSFTIQSNGTTINATDGISISLGIANPSYSEIRAFYGQTTIPLLQDSILLKIFRNTDAVGFAGTKFRFSNPYIRLRFNNSIDLPLAFNFNQLDAYDVNTGVNTQILGAGVNTFTIPTPTTPGQVATDSLIINQSNSNVADIISPNEQFIIVDFDATPNPSGKTINRFYPNSKLNVDAKVVLPLEGYTSGWRIRRNIDFSLSNELDGVTEAAFRFNIENKFPLDVKLKFYLLDGNETVIDSLMPQNNFLPAGGTPNAQGRVLEPTKVVEDLIIDQGLLSNLKAASKIQIVAELQTTNADINQIVAIYDDYYIDVKLGLKFGYRLKIGNNE